MEIIFERRDETLILVSRYSILKSHLGDNLLSQTTYFRHCSVINSLLHEFIQQLFFKSYYVKGTVLDLWKYPNNSHDNYDYDNQHLLSLSVLCPALCYTLHIHHLI